MGSHALGPTPLRSELSSPTLAATHRRRGSTLEFVTSVSSTHSSTVLAIVVNYASSSSETHPGQAQGGRATPPPGDSDWAELLGQAGTCLQFFLVLRGLSPALGVSFADHCHP